MVVPAGGRYWRYNYRFEGKQKTIALGVYPAHKKRELRNAQSRSQQGVSYDRTMG
jgi:hypothetical protein